jgi:plasmid stabilization system protein ParE
MGIRFTELREEDRRAILDYISGQRAEEQASEQASEQDGLES